MRPVTRPTLVRTVVDDFWETTPPPESDHFWAGFDVVEVKPGMAGDALPGGRVAVITRDQGTSPPGSVNPPALIAAIDLLRTRKTAYEVVCLAEASRRAVRGHRHVAELFLNGTPSELDLHLAYLGASEQDEARAPYQNIVALGAHSTILHYVAYTRERVTGDTSFLIDAGPIVCSRSRCASSASAAAASTSSSTAASRGRCSRTGSVIRSASPCTTRASSRGRRARRTSSSATRR